MLDTICNRTEAAAAAALTKAVGQGGAAARGAVAALLLPQYTCTDTGVALFDAVFKGLVAAPETNNPATIMQCVHGPGARQAGGRGTT